MRLIVAVCFAAAAGGLPATITAQDAQAQLWDASVSGDTALLRDALARGARVDSLDTRQARNGRRALNWAALNNQVDAIHLLLAAGASLDSTNLTGFTALHHAAERGSREAAEALLAAGADPRRLTYAGMTSAAIARGNGFATLAVLLERAEQAERPGRR